MNNFIKKAQSIQDKLIDNYHQRKNDKEQCYREFLTTTTRPLPGYRKLLRWRNECFIVAFCCLCEPMLQMMFFYSSMWYELSVVYFRIETIYVFFGAAFILSAFFGVMFDWCIYRRFDGVEKTLIEW